jgi:ABC-2 type transport system permease protein
MSTYVRLLGIFYRNALMNELEYRLNFWSRILMQLFWLGWSIVGLQVFFVYADEIAGWTYNELLVVLGIFFIMKGYRSFLLLPNLARMSEHIRTGTLDYILTKPIDSQFLVSLRHFQATHLSDGIFGLGLVIYALWLVGLVPAFVDVLLFAILIAAAMVVLYTINLVLQSLTIWLVNLERADSLVDLVIEVGRFPVAFYGPWVRWILTAVVPVALVTTFPALAILGRLDLRLALVTVAVAAFLFVLSRAFWKKALRSYTSASS